MGVCAIPGLKIETVGIQVRELILEPIEGACTQKTFSIILNIRAIRARLPCPMRKR